MTLLRRRRGLVCQEAVALMTAYLEGALRGRDRSRLEGHLAACPHCSEYLAQLRVTIDALGHVEPEDLPDHTVDERVEVYRRWRSEEPYRKWRSEEPPRP
jgi:anti-sigma factor RsiW